MANVPLLSFNSYYLVNTVEVEQTNEKKHVVARQLNVTCRQFRVGLRNLGALLYKEMCTPLMARMGAFF